MQACLGVTGHLHFLTEWSGSFTYHCGNTGVQRTPGKSQHTKLTLEKKNHQSPVILRASGVEKKKKRKKRRRQDLASLRVNSVMYTSASEKQGFCNWSREGKKEGGGGLARRGRGREEQRLLNQQKRQEGDRTQWQPNVPGSLGYTGGNTGYTYSRPARNCDSKDCPCKGFLTSKPVKLLLTVSVLANRFCDSYILHWSLKLAGKLNFRRKKSLCHSEPSGGGGERL